MRQKLKLKGMKKCFWHLNGPILGGKRNKVYKTGESKKKKLKERKNNKINID